MGLRVDGLGSRVQGSGLGFKVEGSRFTVEIHSLLRVWVLVFRVQGSYFVDFDFKNGKFKS